MNKKSLIIILIILGLIAVGIYFFYNITGNAIKPYCIDSDRGLNYSVFGNVTQYSFGRVLSYNDSCLNNKTLAERYCNRWQTSYFRYNCPNGCENGRCKEKKVIPSFSLKELPGIRPDHEFDASDDYWDTYRVGERLFAFVSLNNPKQERLQSSVFIYFNNTLLENFNLSCENYVRTNKSVCMNNYFFSKLKNGNNTYFVRFIVSNLTGAYLETNTSLNLDLYAPEPNSRLCVPLIEENNPNANRINVVFLGQEFTEESFLSAIPSMCFSDLSSYCRSKGNWGNLKVLNHNKENITFNCTDGPGGSKVFTATYREINSTKCGFLNKGFEEVLIGVSKNLAGIDEFNEGLLSVEPFKSNKDKFNFWYINRSERITDCNASKGYRELQNCLYYSYLFNSCNFSNQINVQLVHSLSVGGNSAILLGVWINNLNPPFISTKWIKTYSEGFVHEMGHLIGGLDDEYVTMPQNSATFIMNKAEDNCYVGQLHTKEECLQNAPWKNMIGEGCGQDGVIDCNSSNPNYYLEIGCYEGCLQFGKGAFRSLSNSIMSRATIPSKRFVFGKWNEYLIQQQLNKYSN